MSIYDETEMTYKGKHGLVHIVVYWIYLEPKYLQLTAAQAKEIGPELLTFPHRVWVTDEHGDITYEEDTGWNHKILMFDGDKASILTFNDDKTSILEHALTLEDIEKQNQALDALKAKLNKFVAENKHQKALARRRELRKLKKNGGLGL